MTEDKDATITRHSSGFIGTRGQLINALGAAAERGSRTVRRICLAAAEEIGVLTTEKHADAEAIGALESKLAEVTAERGAARDEGFAQGIEAAAKAIAARIRFAKESRKQSDNGDRWNSIIAHLMQTHDDVIALSPTPQADPADMPSPEEILDLIGEFGREVFYLLDNSETSGPVGQEVHTITDESLKKVSDLLDRIDALPFEDPGCILGTGAMLQEAVKRTLSDRHQQADPVREAARAMMPGAIEALSAYQQADMDGIMVLVSRQAIEECLPVLRALAQKGE